MTGIVYRTYTPSDLTTPLATLTTRAAKCHWEAKRTGSGSAEVLADTPDADIPGGAIVAVEVEGVDDPVFGWVIDADPLVPVGRKSTPVIRLAGLGLRRILDYAQVWPPDCPLPGDEVVFGWQHPEFDDSGWATVEQYGTVGSQPFSTPRPTGWPVKEARYVTDDTDSDDAKTLRFRRSYLFDDDTPLGFCVSADDELPEQWANGVRLSEIEFSGKYQWKRFKYIVLDVCAGDFTIAAKVEGLDIPPPNPTWYLMAGALPSGDGLAAAANEQVTIDTGASSTGQWIGRVNGTPTTALDWDASASAVKAAFEAAADDPITLEKTSSGPHTWLIEFDGPRHAATPVIVGVENLSLDGTVSINTNREGQSGYVVEDANGAPVMTNASWKVHVGDDDPGMTPGHILRLCLEAAQARGDTDLDHVILGFDDTNDTDGTPWSTVVLRVPMQDTTVGRIVELLEAMGFVFDMTIQTVEGVRRLVLDGWVKNGRGQDLTGTVQLARDDIRIVSLDRRYDTIKNVFRSVTEDGFHDTPDTDSIATYGRREATSADAVFESASEADQYANEDLDNLAIPQLVSTFAVKPSAARPWLDGYGQADVIVCPSRSSDTTDMRVVGIELAQPDGGNLELTVTAVS